MNELTREMIEEWIDASTTLKATKDEEMELRKDICSTINEQEEGYGTKTVEAHGFKLKATFGLSYKIDEDVLEALKDQLTEADLACIRWKPQLDVAAFKALSSDLLNEIVIVTPSAPTLKVG